MDPLQEQGTGIDKMEASREMDALVEKELSMGIAYEFPPGMITALPHYSTDISAAWLVVEKMRSQYECIIRVMVLSPAQAERIGAPYGCNISGGRLEYPTPDIYLFASADTTPLAICRAALKAVGMVDVIGLGNGDVL